MQVKTIKKTISEKLTDWTNSITDPQLANLVKKNALVSGGSITSMLLGEKVNDYDIYLQDRETLKKLVEYYTKDFQGVEILDGKDRDQLIAKFKDEMGFNEDENLFNKHHSAYAIAIRTLKPDQIKLFFSEKKGGRAVNEGVTDKKYIPKYFSPNAISLSDDIQIVIRFHGTAEQIHKTFDFIHATNYFTFSDGLMLNKDALAAILTKQLHYQGSNYPVTSIIRIKKFLKRGWNISAGEILKIVFEVSGMDLSDPDTLEEQLIGVDVAYFGVLIGALRAKYDSDKEFKLTPNYLATLIDKIFQNFEEDEPGTDPVDPLNLENLPIDITPEN